MKRKWGSVLAGGFFTLSVFMPVWGQDNSSAVDEIAQQVRLARKKKEDAPALKGFSFICAYGTADDVKKALAVGADAGAGDPAYDEMLPLAIAAAHNPDPAVVPELLAAGANVSQPSGREGRTPLHFALMTNPDAVAVVGALLLADADVYALDRFQSTPIDFAINGNYRNGAFNANPREELLLMLLKTAERLPFTMPKGDRKTFMTRKLRQYDINMGRGWRDGDVVSAFKYLGADERVMRKD